MKSTLLLMTTILVSAACSKDKGGGVTVEIAKMNLTAKAPKGTEVSDMMGDQMLQGPNLLVTVGKPSQSDPPELDKAVAAMKDTYQGMTNLKKEKLSDGWIFSAENSGSMGKNYWVKSIRTIGGKAIKCETTASSSEQQANAITTCKSLAPKK